MADWSNLDYHSGFGGEFESEALPGALPKGQNNPRKCPYGLYAEQLSGSAFTCPRTTNARTWFYKQVPSIKTTTPLVADKQALPNLFADWNSQPADPVQKRWSPFKLPSKPTTFTKGLYSLIGAGSARERLGNQVYIYSCDTSMTNESFYNADGEMLIVPQQGTLRITTECGRMAVQPTEICVIPQGIRFTVEVDGPSRGYVCEVIGRRYILPDLGPIGANGLAQPRDFLTPKAWYDDAGEDKHFKVVCKYQNESFSSTQSYSPYNSVAWFGNFAPYKYDCKKFMVINATSFDHADPSIFTVLTAQSGVPGVALCDFVIFPPRWAVQEHTFRPPYYHRNCMSEFMGLVKGTYEAKAPKEGEDPEKGFFPGGGSLHSMMTPHGPDHACFEKATADPCLPEKIEVGNLAFMFESCLGWALSPYAQKTCDVLDGDYYKCWQDLENKFDKNWTEDQREDVSTAKQHSAAAAAAKTLKR